MGKIHLLHNIPLDNSYSDTLYFANGATQVAYFLAHTKYSRDDFTPIRLQNKIRYPMVADALWDCNYLMFQNTNYGNKWFYCFITDLNYIDSNMTEIGFQIDVMQTWMFNYTLGTCYIEREHTETDAVGDHCLIEPINPGQYILEQSLTDTDLLDMHLVAQYAPNAIDPLTSAVSLDEPELTSDTVTYNETNMAKPDPGLNSKQPIVRDIGGVMGGFYSGLKYIGTSMLTTPGTMDSFLEGLINTGRAGNVVSTYVMPSIFYTTSTQAVTHNIQIPKAENQGALGTYVPKNKKCLVYPYNMLQVSNSMGQVHNYRWEYFTSVNVVTFSAVCAMGSNPTVILYPRNYNNQEVNQDEALTLSGYPQFAFAIDTYKAYLAQNSSSILLDTAKTLAKGTASALSGNVAGTVSSLAELVETKINLGKAELEPDVISGQQNGASAIAANHHNFYFSTRHITEEYAKCVDDYFTMFGYLVNRIGVPNLTSRPHWNYIKTIDCNATGSVPFNDMAAIKSIYNNGIRFWHDGSVGNYDQDNSP